MKKLVVIGGGTGLSVMLRGLKQLQNTQLSAIVTVSDDGGSTGRLREQFHIPAMGDIRSVMYALAEEETLFTELMNFRFEGSQHDVGGHSLGNLILTALTQTTGSFMQAIQTLSKVLNVKGEIIPSTLQPVTLVAELQSGKIIRGESNIPQHNEKIKHVFFEEDVSATPQAIQAIREADLIIYGIGSLYTSIIPNIIIHEITEALKATSAQRVYFCNAMTQPGETDGYSLVDHVSAIEAHSFLGAVQTVITYNNTLPAEVLQKYSTMGSVPVHMGAQTHSCTILKQDLLTVTDSLVRHNPDKIRKIIAQLLY